MRIPFANDFASGAFHNLAQWRRKAELFPSLFLIPCKARGDARWMKENDDAGNLSISDNLAAWLAIAPGPIIPPNFDRLAKLTRKHFNLSHDEARHSFISYHVALHRSIGDAALQAGNSEAIVKRHYLNTHTQDEGSAFFRVTPDLKRRRAVLAALPKTKPKAHLKVV
jgi:hypothetical protein